MASTYCQLLTPEERAQTFKIAAASVLCEPARLTKQSAGIIAKVKGGISGIAGGAAAVQGGLKTVLAISLLTGVPLGAAAHVLGQQNKVRSNKERDALDRISRYRDAAKSLATQLS